MQWCRARGVGPLPAEPEVVAAFLAHEAERGLRTSTVARRASGIRLLHQLCPEHYDLQRSIRARYREIGWKFGYAVVYRFVRRRGDHRRGLAKRRSSVERL